MQVGGSDVYAGVVWDDHCLDKVYLPRWWGLVMWWERICSDVWLLRRRYHFVINEILDLMTESKA